MNVSEQRNDKGRTERLKQAHAEGLEPLRTTLEMVLTARAIPLSEPTRAKLESCSDVVTLSTWIGRAVNAPSEKDIFDT